MKFPGAVSLFLLVIFTVPSQNVTAQSSNAAVAFGNRHAVALRTNGEVLTWGENVYCQLGRASRQLPAEARSSSCATRRRSRPRPTTRWS